MDPLSLAASIVAVLQLTSTLTSYINEVRNATAEQAKVAVEASNLYGLLTTLRFRVQEARSDDPWFNQVKLLGSKNGPLDQFKDTLEIMVNEVLSFRKRDQIKSALSWKFTKKEVGNAVARMERLKSLISCALTNDLMYVQLLRGCERPLTKESTLSKAIHDDIVVVREQTEQLHTRIERLHTLVDQNLPNKLSQWLCIPDPSTNYHAALQKRHPKTGQWLLNGQQFADWKNSTTSLMWLHGSAGCGKTILSAASLHHILNYKESHPDTTVSYFYFDFKDVEKQCSRMAIRSLLFQCALQGSDVIQDLERLYQKCDNGRQQPAEDVTQSLFRKAAACPGQKYVILDALDECTDREDLLLFVCELMKLKPRDLHVLATSRREKDIEDGLSPIATHNINIQSALVDADIHIYIHDRMATDTKLKKWPDSVRNEITTTLMEKAGGMFRWVYCQLESIRQCVKLSALRKALSSLPKNLDETYNRILQSLESTGQLQDAISALQWLCFSSRPLNLAEIVEILAIGTADQGGFFPEERLPDPTDVMVVCSSLISLDPINNDNNNADSWDGSKEDARRIQIQLSHFSVKEFLLSSRCAFDLNFRPQICHLAIAEGCLHYLLHLCQNAPLTEELIEQYPLSLYAAKEWWQHTQNTGNTISDALSDLASGLLTNEDTALLSWRQLYDIDNPWGGPYLWLKTSDIAQPLYYAATIGVPEICVRILQRNVDVNDQGGQYGHALQAASSRGHEKVVKMLVDAGADVNAQGGYYGSALQAASFCGYEKVVKVLVDAGTDVNAQGGYYGSALQAASESRQQMVVKMLVDAGADVNARGGRYGNALQAASSRGHETVVKMLVDAGADVNAQGGRHGNPLEAASEGGYDKVVKILIDAGANVNTQEGYGNALYTASESGYEKVVEILLDAGADVNAQGGYYGNALQAASYRGDEKVVKMLMDSGADVNAQGGRYGNALQAALFHGDETIVKMLMDYGADVNAQGGRYGNALQAASFRGDEKVVKMLMDAGADVNAQGGYYGSALQAASIRGDEKVVKMLVDAGADINARGGYYSGALQAASYHGDEKVVRLLIDAGADINAQGGCYGSALQAASSHGDEMVVRLLIDAGADVNAEGGLYGNALQAASRRSYEKVVKMLVDAGAVSK
ncbi:uncharacterized protein Z518_03317 [Rhinocladiella mackenziei CBS 650.93]|uniref:Nephrocystin 3-like N-terminal domain-containing protein n=1 Tax=Rhinocladiella mackenziei CBS 650.93 TaxID=1442369 RepID=A0A0D2JH16_9EURO|nr:uncharacterized protein Z518_03317 [Rhinocladiella mackenziei CBS 650.93]KIX08660.1 hypothetical protein Z518_03317 [Rhinocladiella mackenziei CBS 650.93]